MQASPVPRISLYFDVPADTDVQFPGSRPTRRSPRHSEPVPVRDASPVRPTGAAEVQYMATMMADLKQYTLDTSERVAEKRVHRDAWRKLNLLSAQWLRAADTIREMSE